jgi:hypothetical protein
MNRIYARNTVTIRKLQYFVRNQYYTVQCFLQYKSVDLTISILARPRGDGFVLRTSGLSDFTTSATYSLIFY